MDKSSEINVYNVNEYVTYERIYERGILIITWDSSNADLTKLMCQENSFVGRKGCYTNSLWVNEMKNILLWEEGKSFNVVIYKNFSDSKLVVKRAATSYSPFLKIDENGYLMIKPLFIQSFERCDCLYNDLLDEENSTYTLK
jgi:hypothetical protein